MKNLLLLTVLLLAMYSCDKTYEYKECGFDDQVYIFEDNPEYNEVGIVTLPDGSSEVYSIKIEPETDIEYFEIENTSYFIDYENECISSLSYEIDKLN